MRCRLVSRRFAQTILFAVLAAARLAAQSFSPSEFSGVSFDQWVSEPEPKSFRWTVQVGEPRLSSHQRPISRIEIRIDGSELAKRRGAGEFVLLMQIADQDNARFRDAESVDLSHIPESSQPGDLVSEHSFFVLPGDYQVEVAAYDTRLKQHFVAHRKFHVGALRNDPLPGAWQNLPPVEFLPVAEGAERWYLPTVHSRVAVAAKPARLGCLEIVLNLSPGDESERTAGMRERNLEVLLPSFKILSQIAHENVRLNATLLDLDHQRVVFAQDDIVHVNAGRLLAAIDDDKPGIIDVKTLENRHSSAQFFAREVVRRLAPPAPPGAASQSCAVIVLSSPVSFEHGADLRPVEARLPAGSKIFYLRYQPLAMVQMVEPIPSITGRRGSSRYGAEGIYTTMRSTGYSVVPDELAAVLKPLAPEVFDISTPEQFRKALAAVLAAIARM